ncbi:uncharacterized protein MELLADRAFT_123421 [Melampsora larici-populina 98AG31]|uniref:Secreted protein n=1 Tax=Melampsora larici-populina (strain 98AG31 / pathotype 3-4-7) TaxID=747676 RepID=F4S106_MELLP|nr:uncharacterized protein MELLADRAFT_123421 [Melampsora larici-populina 98AG31]EGG01685.1 secreted protein [Melampsora larici-populina 98AG31]
MLRIFLKIAFLLYSFESHGLNAKKPLYTVTCNGGFSSYTGGHYNRACRLIHDGERHYNCRIENCWDDIKKNQWVPFNRCQLANSPNKQLSNQQCSSYNYRGSDSDGKSKGYDCTTAGGVQYVCPDYAPDTVNSLTCEHCRAGNW